MHLIKSVVECSDVSMKVFYVPYIICNHSFHLNSLSSFCGCGFCSIYGNGFMNNEHVPPLLYGVLSGSEKPK